MQLINILTLIATCALTTVTAQGSDTDSSLESSGARYPSACGYYLVNQWGKTQSDIASIKCGRTDTCNGEEWNTVFSMSLTGTWYAQQFCSSGCYVYDSAGLTLAACH